MLKFSRVFKFLQYNCICLISSLYSFTSIIVLINVALKCPIKWQTSSTILFLFFRIWAATLFCMTLGVRISLSSFLKILFLLDFLLFIFIGNVLNLKSVWGESVSLQYQVFISLFKGSMWLPTYSILFFIFLSGIYSVVFIQIFYIFLLILSFLLLL